MNHFYFITDKSIETSLTTTTSNSSKNIQIKEEEGEDEKEKQYYFNVDNHNLNELYKELPNKSIESTNNNLNSIRSYVIKDNIMPVIKYESLTIIK
jgi:hypothetical protein